MSLGSASEDVSSSFEIVDSSEISEATSAEAYLTLPEEILAMTRVSDLQDAVDRCKAIVKNMPDDNDEKKWLIRRLIELRLRLHDITEALKDDNNGSEDRLKNYNVVLGHHFVLQNHPKSLTSHYCDRCSGVIWNALHSWHLCTDCDYKCHVWCLNQVCRICAHVVACEEEAFIYEICPEPSDGLAGQNYRCAECLTRTSFTPGLLGYSNSAFRLPVAGETTLIPRRCEYNGKYYCPTCHWNSTAIIPARVILNWDFTERKVSRASKQILKLLVKSPILRLEQLNPMLFGSVEGLTAVKSIRHRILLMKKYLTSCKIATKNNITWQLADRLHFLENEDKYSLQDLIDLETGILLPVLHKLIEVFLRHITIDCPLCQGKGYYCELCKDNNVIFPFEPDIECCPTCSTAYHFTCWVHLQNKCLKCKRNQLRRESESLVEEI